MKHGGTNASVSAFLTGLFFCYCKSEISVKQRRVSTHKNGGDKKRSEYLTLGYPRNVRSFDRISENQRGTLPPY